MIAGFVPSDPGTCEPSTDSMNGPSARSSPLVVRSIYLGLALSYNSLVITLFAPLRHEIHPPPRLQRRRWRQELLHGRLGAISQGPSHNCLS